MNRIAITDHRCDHVISWPIRPQAADSRSAKLRGHFGRSLARVRMLRSCRMSDIVGLHRLKAQRSKLISLTASRFAPGPGREDRKVLAANPNSGDRCTVHPESIAMNANLARRDEFATVGQAHERAMALGPELAVVIPTLNEKDNVAPLVELLDTVLDGVNWEVIFVDDDSPDATAKRIREISRRDRRVRCLQRIGRRGLTTACIEGALATSAPYIAVMDADMQHDEKLLPQMLATLKSEPVDLVVGSRYIAGGGTGGLSSTRV